MLDKKNPAPNIDLPYQYFEQTQVRKLHHFYLNQGVEQPDKYSEMVFIIQTAGPDDVVYIHLNTPGGNLNTGVQIVNAMKSTQAHVICGLEGEVASLGTIMFLAADEFIVHDNCMMMFHNYSGGVFGKGHEQIAALDATTKWIHNIMEELYVPFMTPEEFTRLVKGEDLYFQAPDIRKRLNKLVTAIKRQRKAEEKKAC